MRKTIIKVILIVVVVGVLFFVGYVLYFLFACGMFDRDYSVTDLKKNFEEKRIEIYELENYFNAIVPKNYFVEIEFENDNTLQRFSIKNLENPTGTMFLEWGLKTNTERMDSIIKPLGWTKETLKQIKEKLDNANCLGIESGEPTNIHFQRSGMGEYFFNIFDKPIPDSLKQDYNDSCEYIYVNNKFVLQYGGGVLGSQCFYNLK